jgi:hypothetical protein
MRLGPAPLKLPHIYPRPRVEALAWSTLGQVSRGGNLVTQGFLHRSLATAIQLLLDRSSLPTMYRFGSSRHNLGESSLT